MIDIDTLIESDGIYQTEYPGGYKFCWRLLTLKEYRIFNGLRDQVGYPEYHLYLHVFKRCYIGNYDLLFKSVPAGMLISIGGLIMYLSGDCDSDTIKNDIDIVRRLYKAGSVQEHMKRTVFTAFPTYTIEDADKWTRVELIKRFVVSEHILANRFGTEYLDLEQISSADKQVKTESSEPVKLDPKIDFDREAAAQKKSLGYWKTREAIEEYEGVSKPSTKPINVKQARALDRMKSARGS